MCGVCCTQGTFKTLFPSWCLDHSLLQVTAVAIEQTTAVDVVTPLRGRKHGTRLDMSMNGQPVLVFMPQSDFTEYESALTFFSVLFYLSFLLIVVIVVVVVCFASFFSRKFSARNHEMYRATSTKRATYTWYTIINNSNSKTLRTASNQPTIKY